LGLGRLTPYGNFSARRGAEPVAQDAPQKIYSNGKIESPRTVFWNKRRACYCEASREKSRGFECVLLLLLLENGERMQYPLERNNGICVIDFFTKSGTE